MSGGIGAIKLENGGEAVLYSFDLDGKHRFCMVSREVINDLGGTNARGEDLLDEFRKHADKIESVTEKAVRGGMAGDPLLIPAVMFFPGMNPGYR